MSKYTIKTFFFTAKFVRSLLLMILFISVQNATAQVTANFTADDTAGCAPMVVHFTNTSSGATSYSWDLGNGTTTALTDVSGSYLTAGVYTITLVAHNGTASSTKSMSIHVYALPTVSFYADDTTICPGGTVRYTSTTTSGSWGGITYNWNFGDGYTSTAVSPSHSYAFSGNYNATLFAANGKGCINSLSKDPYILVYTPASVSFSTPTTTYCKPPAAVLFANTSIGVTPFSCQWRFGDGGTSSFTAATHTYTAPGTYDVFLKVTDGHGCPDSALLPGYITIGNTSTSFTYPPAGCINIPDTFNNTSTTHISSVWDFGDGGTSVSESPVHTYTATGIYSVRLIIYTGICYDTTIHSITISHPTGSISFSPHDLCIHPTITFSASVPTGCTATWRSYNHGLLGTGTTLSYTYPYRVFRSDSIGEIDSITMIISNPAGCKDTVTTMDTINSLKISGWAPFEGCAPLVVRFSASPYSLVYDFYAGAPFWRFGYYPLVPPIISYDYPDAITSYVWDFGDGSPVSTLASPAHTYSVVGGVYAPSCTLMSATGCRGKLVSSDNPVRVGSMPPMPSFTRTPSHICTGQPVHFTSVASGLFNGYVWHFGDLNTDTAANPVHTYTVPGIYTVEFAISYNGCATPYYSLVDTSIAPSAVIGYNFDCSNRRQIFFSDLSIGEDSHIWQFGDGTTSAALNPAHVYPAIDTYNVYLTTYNATTGCRDTTHSRMVLTGLNALFTDSSASICRDVQDTIAFEVKNGLFHPDTTMVTKYAWYTNGVMRDTLRTGYNFDTVAYSFHTVGINNIAVVLTDNHGCLDTFATTVLVAKPIDSFVFSPPSGCAPLLVNFTDHSRDVTGASPSQYRWFYGDGISVFSGSPSVTHEYTASGTYAMEEIVTDNIGCSDTLLSLSRIIVHKPAASFNATSTGICARKSVHFTNSSSRAAASVWIFGDGDTSSVTSPNHVYTASGTYTVKLVVIDTFGCTDTMVRNNYITVHPTPVSAFYMTDSFAVCSPFNVVFNNTTTGATSYYWIFGDGTSSLTASPSDVYIRPGYYTVKLLATNIFSCTDTSYGHVNLFGYSGAFTYSPLSGCAPLGVRFAASVSSVSSLTWDFSDGVTSTPSLIDTITHIYTANGSFVPKLILTDSFGCTNFSVGRDTIKVGALSTGFSIAPNPVCQGNTISFHDSSSSSLSTISGWLWSFASGVTSTMRAPTYAYSVAGTYPVTLTVSDSRGCSGSVTRNVIVNSLPPAIAVYTTVCKGVADTLTDSVSGGIWSSSNMAVATVGSLSGLISGLSPGTSVITYSLGSGCTVTQTITVNHSPSAITGVAVLCAGNTTTLTDTTGAGTWSSSATGIAGVSSGGIVTGASAGTVAISYTVGGCPAIKIVTVNPVPPAIVAPPSVCVGTTAILTDSLPGGIWTSTTTSIATITPGSGIVTAGSTPGIATIRYTMPTGCSTSTTLLISAPPDPIVGSNFVCIGSSVTFTDGVGGGIWSSSDVPVAIVGSLSGIVSGVGTGTTTINYNDGGCIASKVISVDVFSGPVNGSRVVCVRSSVTLSSVGSGTWSSSNTALATVGSSSGIVTGIAPGYPVITYSLGGGCTASVVITVNALPAGITGSRNICIGATSLYNSSSPGGTWSSQDTTIVKVNSGGLASAIGWGSTAIHYTLSTGCSVSDTINVIVIPPFTGPATMCAWGDTATIFNADISGTYTSTLATITNLGSGAGFITTYAPGVATIVYTNSTGCALTKLLTVNPLPGEIRGTTKFCIGTSVTFVDTSVGGVWSSSGTGSISIGSSTGVVTALSGGVATITYTLPTGCIVDTVLRVDTVLSPGVISGPDSLCKGAIMTLTDTTRGGVWSTAHIGGISAGSATGIITGVLAGIDTVRYSVSNTCGVQMAKKVVTVNPIPSAGVIVGADSLCAGGTVSLTDTATGGIWSSSNATASVSASGVATANVQGLDTVSYTVSRLGCTSVAAHYLVINPIAITGSISGRSVLCVGDTIILSDTASGGVWSASNGAVTIAGGIANGISTGTDTIYYSVTNSCGTLAAAHTVIVNAAPAPVSISGAANVCVGDTIMFADTEAGGLWSSSDANASVGSLSGIVTGIVAGKDTIAYTLVNTCGSAFAAQPITINPLPDAGSIGGASELCVGDSIVLTDPATGGTWSMSNAAASVSGAAIVVGLSAGVDTVRYTVTNNCGTAVATQPITVDTLPIAQTIIVNGATLSVPVLYASYQWTLNGVPIPGATMSTYTFTASGNYGVVVANGSGCEATYPSVYASDCSPADIEVFPNPVESVVYIKWCKPVTAVLSVSDGKTVMELRNATEMDLSGLPNAVYSLTIFDESGHKVLTKRITKL